MLHSAYYTCNQEPSDHRQHCHRLHCPIVTTLAMLDDNFEGGQRFMGYQSILMPDPEDHHRGEAIRQANDPLFWTLSNGPNAPPPTTTTTTLDPQQSSHSDPFLNSQLVISDDKENFGQHFISSQTSSSSLLSLSTTSSQPMEIVRRVRELEIDTCNWVETIHSPSHHDQPNRPTSVQDGSELSMSTQTSHTGGDLLVYRFLDDDDDYRINANQQDVLQQDYSRIGGISRTNNNKQSRFKRLKPRNEQKTRKRRKTRDQLLRLQAAFVKNHHPDLEQKRKIAKMVGLDLEGVRLWFKYARQKDREANKSSR